MKKLFINLEVEFTDEQFSKLGYDSVEEAIKGTHDNFVSNEDGKTTKCEVRIEEIPEGGH